MNESVFERRGFILFILLLIIIYFPIFLHLSCMPIRMWDESVNGLDAIEMMHNHHYFVSYFDGKPNVELEPPLMLWCVIFFSKILGFSELSLRLPSALAALALCLYLFFTLAKYTGNYFYGFFTVCILITCQGYVRNHVIRTGEYDSLLALFSTLFAFQIFYAVESNSGKERSFHLFMFFVFFTMAVLTKGPACLMQVPGLGVYVLARKKIFTFIKDKATYRGLAVFVVFGLGYYLLHESINPGYLKALWSNEISNRYGSPSDGHTGPPWFYIKELFTWQFNHYLFLTPFALMLGLCFCGSRIKRLVTFAATAGFPFFIIISFSATKLGHYDAPLFPYLAIITASLFWFLFTLISEWSGTLITCRDAALIGLICILSLLTRPYVDIINKVYDPHGDKWEEGFSESCKFFQEAALGEQAVEPYKLVFEAKPGYGPATVLNCYAEEMEEKGLHAQFIGRKALAVNDKAVIFDGNVKYLVEQDYEIELLKHLDYCNADIIRLISVKPKPTVP